MPLVPPVITATRPSRTPHHRDLPAAVKAMLDHDFELISTASVYDGPEDQQGRKTGRSPAVQGHYGAFANTDAALRENRWVTMHNLPGKMAGSTAPATTPRLRRSSSSLRPAGLRPPRHRAAQAADQRRVRRRDHVADQGTARHGAGRPGLLLRRAQQGPDGLLVFGPIQTYNPNSSLADGTRSGSAS